MNSEHVILKPVPGMKNVFATSDGRVFRQIDGAISNGYHVVGICQNKKRWQGRVSRLVAAAFLGPCPPGYLVCHNDGNSRNDSLSNLRYDTPKGNSADMLKHGTRRLGEDSHFAKLTEEAVLAIRRRWAEGGVTCLSLAHEFGVSKSNISLIVTQKTWSHL